jgi:hypothetical protein
MAERRKARRATDDEEVVAEQEPSDQEIPDEDEPLDEDEVLDVDRLEPSGEDESPANGRRNGRRRPARRDKSALTAREAAKAALRQIAELTTKQVEGITDVERTEDGWVVGIEVVEDRRIPSSADILATYETTIDADGELLSYRRLRRYTRGRADSSEES